MFLMSTGTERPLAPSLRKSILPVCRASVFGLDGVPGSMEGGSEGAEIGHHRPSPAPSGAFRCRVRGRGHDVRAGSIIGKDASRHRDRGGPDAAETQCRMLTIRAVTARLGGDQRARNRSGRFSISSAMCSKRCDPPSKATTGKRPLTKSIVACALRTSSAMSRTIAPCPSRRKLSAS